MASALTGGFDAVLQISLRTIYRLLATMHQNSDTNATSSDSLPKLPHRLTFRIDGTKGLYTAQVGVPAIELVPGSEMTQDSQGQVKVSCRIRARFEPDVQPITQPMDQFIHGQVRATFAVGVEPLPDGTDGIALRVTPSDTDADFKFDPTKLPATALEVAAAQYVAVQFRDFIRSWSNKTPFVVALGTPPFELRVKGLAAAGLQALALPLALPQGQPPPATMGGLSQIVTDGDDFAVAVAEDYIHGRIQGFLDTIKASPPEPNILGVPYTVQVSKALATWIVPDATADPDPSFATIKFHFEGDASPESALADDLGLPDAHWSAGFYVQLTFDPGTQAFVFTATGDPSANVDLPWPYGGKEDDAEDAIKNEVKPRRDEALAEIQNDMAMTLSELKSGLETLLGKLDKQAKVTFKSGHFRSDGVVLRGTVKLSLRQKAAPVTIEALPDGSGYSGFANWLPGGWIGGYTWKWTWWDIDPATGLPYEVPVTSSTNFQLPQANPHLHSHSELFEDRFVLQVTNLPGLPKTGNLCLTISGVQVDPVTGEEVDYVSLQHSTSEFSPGHYLRSIQEIQDELMGGIGTGACWEASNSPTFPVPPLDIYVVHPDPPELWYRQWLVEPEARDPWRVADFDLFPRRRQVSPTTRTTNLLAQFLSAGSGEASLRVIDQALRASGQSSRGIVVLLVVQEGASAQVVGAFAEAVRAPGRDLPGVQVLAIEDIRQSWSRIFDVTPSVWARGATRLVDAHGRLAMRHDGPTDPETLARTLTERLVQSAPQRRNLFALSATAGDSAPDFFFEMAPGRRIALHHLRGRSVVLGFAQPWSIPSLATLRQLQRVHERAKQGGITVVGVIAEGDARELDKLRHEHGLTFAIAPDPRRRIARAYDIQAWPTIVTINTAGEVRTRIGVDRGAILTMLGLPSQDVGARTET